MKLLFIDDEEFGNEYLVDDLTDMKVEVDWIQKVDMLFDMAVRDLKMYDVCLLDIMIPDPNNKLPNTMRGLKTGIRIAEYFDEQGIDLPIVVLSGRAKIEEEIKNKKIVSQVLKKPKSVQEIIEALNNAIDKKDNDY